MQKEQMVNNALDEEKMIVIFVERMSKDHLMELVKAVKI